MNDEEAAEPLPGDNPIREPTQDVLERAATAAAFARQVLALDATEGAAVGVFGPWGSGKTSFVNLARKTFEDSSTPVLDFNPWLFSGTEQLVERFFTELSAELKLLNLNDIGDALEEYGDAFSGSHWTLATIAVIPKLLGKCLRRHYKGVTGYREKVKSTLAKRDKKIIVILDDVDRLSGGEIRDVFKLVRLTASFPNIIYVVPCDRLRVERALDEKEHGLTGRDYLEKIIQLPYNLPEISKHILREQTYAAIDGALADIEDSGPFDKDAWADIQAEIVGPLIRNMRDVRRYAAAMRGTVADINGQVALADVLGLEAISVFLPDVFRRLPGAIDGLP